MADKLTRFRWERAVIGPGGPDNPTTRHVLLTLATHANRDLQCWPTTKLLAQETGYSERAVCTHLDIAATSDGFISRTRRNTGKGWANYVYRLTLPHVRTEPRSAASGPDGTEPRSAGKATDDASLEAFAAELGSIAAERHADGTEPDDSLALNDVQSNNVPNTSINNKGNIKSVAGSPSASPAPSPLSDFPSTPEQLKKPKGNGKAVARSWQQADSAEYHTYRQNLIERAKPYGLTPDPSETNGQFAARICTAMLGAKA